MKAPGSLIGWWLTVMLASGLGASVWGAASRPSVLPVPEEEPSFETLLVGTETLTNVTVYQRKKDLVYLRHDGGLLGIKVSQLGQAARVQLGYEQAPAPSAAKGSDSVVAAAVSGSAVEGGSGLGSGSGSGAGGPAVMMMPAPGKKLPGLPAGLTPEALMRLGMTLLLVVAAIALVVHLVMSALLRMICIKAGSEPGFLIWLPLLQVFPLLQAAGMSRAWPLALVGLSVAGALLLGIAPTLGVAASFVSSVLGVGLGIIWSVRICVARGKHPALGLLLLLPVVNLVTLVYLAVSK